MRLLAIISISFKRLRNRGVLTLLLIACVALAVGVMVCVPVFAGAVGKLIVQKELIARTESLNRPPFPVRIYALPRPQHPMTLQDSAYARDWIADMLVRRIGLPIKVLYVQNDSPPLRMRPRPDDVHYTDQDLATIRVVCVQDIDEHIGLVAGVPFGDSADPKHLNVWVLPAFADELGLRVGEIYHLAYFFSKAAQPISVKIAGFWEAVAPEEPYWYKDPSEAFMAALLTTPEQYQIHIAPIAAEGTGFSFWYYVLDDAKMNLNRAEQYIKGLDVIEQEVKRRLPSAGVDCAPTNELQEGHRRKTLLSVMLVSFSLPLMGILFFFIASATSMAARSQMQETAMLMSRGASRWQILALISLETVIVLALACPLGVLGGVLLARLLGYCRGFLALGQRIPLEVHIASADWRLVGVAIAVCFISGLVPAWLASRFSIVAFERQSARRRYVLGATRALVTALLVGVTLYAYRQLVHRGEQGLTGWQLDDPLRDPLVLLAPALFTFIAPLIATEVFILLMRSLTLIGRLQPSATAHLACISLGREGGQYRVPICLLVLCLSLGVYYASMAKSADIWLIDRLRYQVGADLTFEQQATEAAAFSGGGAWLLPISEYEEIDGVAKVTRVGEFVASIPFGKSVPRVRLLGIERMDFPQVAYFRSDFSQHSLGELMNRLAKRLDGIVVSKRLAARLNMGEGERLPLDLKIEGEWYSLEFNVVGTFEYFPTMYEDKAPVVVTNLAYLHTKIGSELSHSIWMRLQPTADPERILRDVRRLNVLPIGTQNLRQMLSLDRQKLERVGMFGLLSISFVAGALLSGGGMFIHNSASIVGRAYRFALLRALGVTRRGVLTIVSVEYIVTLLYGLLAGIALGVLGSHLYVPFFPLTQNPKSPIPPFIPLTDWESAGGLGAAMGVALVLMQSGILARIARTRLFEALRLGIRE